MMYAQWMFHKKLYKGALHNFDKIKWDRRIPRRELQPYKRCAFEFLFQLKNEQSLLNATGHDHTSFFKLLELFKPYYDYYTIDPDTNEIRHKTCHANGIPYGKKCDMKARGALGLVLM